MADKTNKFVFDPAAAVPIAAELGIFPGDPEAGLDFATFWERRLPEIGPSNDSHTLSQFVIRLCKKAKQFSEQAMTLNFARGKQMLLNKGALIALRELVREAFNPSCDLDWALACYIWQDDVADSLEVLVRERIVYLARTCYDLILKANISLRSPLGKWLVVKVLEDEEVEDLSLLCFLAKVQKMDILAKRAAQKACRLTKNFAPTFELVRLLGWDLVSGDETIAQSLVEKVSNIMDVAHASEGEIPEELAKDLCFKALQVKGCLNEAICAHNLVIANPKNARLAAAIRLAIQKRAPRFVLARITFETLDFSKAPEEAYKNFAEFVAMQACELEEIGYAMRFVSDAKRKEVADRLPSAKGTLPELINGYNYFLECKIQAAQGTPGYTEAKMCLDVAENEYVRHAKEMCQSDLQKWYYVVSSAAVGSHLYDEACVKIGMERIPSII